MYDRSARNRLWLYCCNCVCCIAVAHDSFAVVVVVTVADVCSKCCAPSELSILFQTLQSQADAASQSNLPSEAALRSISGVVRLDSTTSSSSTESPRSKVGPSLDEFTRSPRSPIKETLTPRSPAVTKAPNSGSGGVYDSFQPPLRGDRSSSTSSNEFSLGLSLASPSPKAQGSAFRLARKSTNDDSNPARTGELSHISADDSSEALALSLGSGDVKLEELLENCTYGDWLMCVLTW